MTKRITKITIVAIALLFNSPVLASDESDLTQLKEYLLAKNFTQAYDYSKSLEFELAGELTYDFLSGLAAFGAERYQAAVFAFERVLINEPSSFDGRYYLALSYQKVGNLPAAVFELETLLVSATINKSITPAQITKVQYQLKWVNQQLVDSRRTWSNDIAFSIGSDSNINSGSSQDDITLPDGTLIPLFDSSKEIADSSYSLQYHTNYQYPLSQYQRLLFDFYARDKRYSKHSEYNRRMLNFSVTYQHEMLDYSTWYLGLSTVPLWFSKKKYRTENSFTFGWQKPIDKTSQFGLNGFISKVDHFVYEDLNFNRYQMNAFYRFYHTFQHTFMLTGYKDHNKKRLKHNNKTSIGATYIIGYVISGNLSGSTIARYEQQKYAQPNPLFNVYNDSSLATLSTELLYSGFDDQIIQLQLNFQDKDLDSQLLAMKIFEYNRLDMNLTWKYAF
ncbi:MAG: hypothetical protein HRT51_09165 [Colwellia sp.]|nr:hypothetical protein [Colwellia sp.]